MADKKCTYDPLIELMAYYAGKKVTKEKSSSKNLTVEERLKNRIIDGDQIGINDDLTEGLGKYSPLEIINNILLEGMKVVGELFGSGQMQLPFVLQSAETMKTAVAFLEPYMEKKENTAKGVIVLATVKGDVHDIGKNLVDIILTNNGYKVHNLGIKISVDAMLEAAEKHAAQAIGMSGLLVKSTLVMKENLELMKGRAIDIPVILGGAALTRRYVEQDLREIYGNNVAYAADAFDGLNYMEGIISGKQISNLTSARGDNLNDMKKKLIDRETFLIELITEEADFISLSELFSINKNEGEKLFSIKLNEDIIGAFALCSREEKSLVEITQFQLFEEQKNGVVDLIRFIKNNFADYEILINIKASNETDVKIFKAFGFQESSESDTSEKGEGDKGEGDVRLSYRKDNSKGIDGREDNLTVATKPIVEHQTLIPPFWGVKIVEDIPIDKVYEYINEVALIRGQWQVKKGTRTQQEYSTELNRVIYPKLEELKLIAKRDKILEPKVAYGYFPCKSDGDSLIVFRPKGLSGSAIHSTWELDAEKNNFEKNDLEEYVRFNFPRQSDGTRLCIADYFKSVQSSEYDVVAFQVVTVGQKASDYTAKLFDNGNYADYLYFHGLSVECAEALAEYQHRITRIELGIAGNDAKDIRKLFAQGYQGSRYSFGYPACPNLEDQTKLFELLNPERIGIKLSEEFMLEPEQSTSAVVVANRAAKYFNVK